MTDAFAHNKVQECLALVHADGIAVPPFVPIAVGGLGLIVQSQIRTGEKVVVKVPRYDARAEEDHWLLERSVRKEAAALETFQSPRVPKLIHANVEGKYLVRNYIPGTSIEEAVEKDHGDTACRASIFRALIPTCRDLFTQFHKCTAGGYVIRDLKPRNLIAWPDAESLTLIDVGSVRPETDMLSKTPRPHRIGSRKWLFWAPEQLLEQLPNLDRRVDYFALGATAYFILSGAPPYENDTERHAMMRSYEAKYEEVKTTLRTRGAAFGIAEDVLDFIVDCLNPVAEDRISDFPSFTL